MNTRKSDSTTGKQKLTISISQAFLLLLERHRDDTECNELKILYLAGRNNTNSVQFDNWLNDKELNEKYIIDKNFDKSVNEPTRRYFETHLALHTRNKTVNDIDIDKLAAYSKHLLELLPENLKNLFGLITNPNLEFTTNDNVIDNMCKEYRDIFNRIKIDNSISEDNREKLILIVTITILSILATEANNTTFPIGIYGAGKFSDKYRGKQLKPEQDTTRSQHMGLLKGHMPLSSTDAAFTDMEFPYLKPSDQSGYDPNAGWVKTASTTCVQSFSNSISGTMLAQLRTMKYFADIGQLISFGPGDFENYIKCLTSTMLYGSGGHTFHEYFEPLKIYIVQLAFSFIPEFKNLTETSLLLDSNKIPFDTALDETIKYNDMLLKRAAAHQELQDNPAKLKPVPPKQKAAASTTTTTFHTAQHNQAKKDKAAKDDAKAGTSKKPGL